MTYFCRCIGLVLIATLGVRAEPAASESPSKIRPAKVEITGRGFVIRLMKKGSIAFKSRSYVWSDVPESIEGLPYTQMAGGGTASIHLKVLERGSLFVSVAANQMLDLKEKGWTLPMPDRSNTFTYTDSSQTLMAILSHEVEEGQEIDIPQMGWPGTIVFLPLESKSGEVKPFTL